MATAILLGAAAFAPLPIPLAISAPLLQRSVPPRCCTIEPEPDERANNVAAAPAAYALVLPLQLIALNDATIAHLAYFLLFSTLTVYLGATARPIRDGGPPELTLGQAIIAPIAASVLLVGLYVLITQFDIDPSAAYRLAVCALGVAALSDVAVQVIAAATRPLLAAAEDADNRNSNHAADAPTDGERPPLFSEAERAAALVLSLVVVGDYASGVASTGGGGAAAVLPAASLVEANLIAFSLALFSIATVSLRTFRVACVFLVGLFCCA